jgi:hypothetical protein
MPHNRSAALQLVAKNFAKLLRKEIGEENFQEVLRLNATPEYRDCCASHNFCDANLLMWAALGHEEDDAIDPKDEEQTIFWNDAWNLAKVEYLTA